MTGSGAFGFRRAADVPTTIPIFPLRGAVLFPRATLPLNIFEPRYLNMVDDAIAGDRLIGMVQPAPRADGEGAPPIMRTGCVGRLTSFAELEDGRYKIMLTGVIRFNVEQELDLRRPYRSVIADYAPYADDLIAPKSDYPMDRTRLNAALRAYVEANGYRVDWQAVESAPAEGLVHAIATLCEFEPAERQALLEARRLDERCATLITLLELNVISGDEDKTLQ